jgi:hypothetical protein
MPGCSKPHYARGFCGMHYKRLLRHGDPEVVAPRGTRSLCAVDSCERTSRARGWCHAHYLRWRSYGDVLADRPLTRGAPDRPCEVGTCLRTVYAKELCQAHYRRLRKHGDVQAEIPLRTVTGQGTFSHGYWYVNVAPEERHLSSGERKMAEHRYVFAKALGRPLAPDEVVHHLNGDRTDNRLENLELWSTAHPKGQRIEDKIAFALGILRRYAPGQLTHEGTSHEPNGVKRPPHGATP